MLLALAFVAALVLGSACASTCSDGKTVCSVNTHCCTFIVSGTPKISCCPDGDVVRCCCLLPSPADDAQDVPTIETSDGGLLFIVPTDATVCFKVGLEYHVCMHNISSEPSIQVVASCSWLYV
jgi:hypothetical protein